MKNVMESMKKDYGYVEFGGEEYVLIQDAYLDDTEYVADAIKADDEPDEDGYVLISSSLTVHYFICIILISEN